MFSSRGDVGFCSLWGNTLKLLETTHIHLSKTEKHIKNVIPFLVGLRTLQLLLIFDSSIVLLNKLINHYFTVRHLSVYLHLTLLKFSCLY